MDSTANTTGCLPDHTHHHATYAEFTDAYWLDSPTFVDDDPPVRLHEVTSADRPHGQMQAEPPERQLGAA
ncbi:hypothetical protein ACWD4J_30280 [Streptomyces sp. NPDC002577]